MNTKKMLKYPLVVGILLTFPVFLFSQEEDDDTVTLSPFTIEEGDSVGYQATNTLAGSRLKTALRDVGSAIQVITTELFDDTGSTTMEEILPYALNMESNGVMGNFADGPGQNHNGRFEQDTQRLNPQSSQRVRGLASASLTRDFFLTDIPFEGYNTQRIAINRGANSLLFGIGSPGGVINNTTKRATADGEDFAELSIRIGERESNRETFDIHKVLIEDRLAVRVMGLYKDTVYQQRPAYELDRRISTSLDAVLFENENVEWLDKTRFRFNSELGSIKGAPPLLTPPGDAFTHFFEAPDVAMLESIPGVYVPGFYGGQGKPGVNLNELGLETNRYHPEFGYTTWKPKQTFDNRLGLSRGNIPFIGERNFHRTKIKFNENGDPITYVNWEGNSYVAHAGNGVGATGTVDEFGNPVGQGPATHAIGVDGMPYPVLNNIWEYVESGSFFMGQRNDQLATNFTTPAIIDTNVWDNENNMMPGLTQFRDMEFNVETFTLEQSFLNGEAGIELAWDNQMFEQRSNIPFSEEETIGDSHNYDVVIDLNEWLMTGEPNPHLGRPMLKTDDYPAVIYRQAERESTRFTGFVNVDFEKTFGEDSWLKWLGRHTITGLYNKQTIDNFNQVSLGHLVGNGFGLGDFEYLNQNGAGLRDADYRPVYEVYLGPDVRQFSDPSQVQLSRIRINQPQIGDGYDILLWNRETQTFDPHSVVLQEVIRSGGRNRNEVTTEVISLQSRLLNEHIVGLVGWRDDTQKSWRNINPSEGAALGISQDVSSPTGPRNPDFFRIVDTPSAEANGDTVTWSVVGHVPDEWLGDNFGLSFHVGESENFQVTGTRRNAYGDVISPPVGTTEEYGVTFNFAQNRLIARLNWYETAAAGSSAAGGTAFNYFSWAVTNPLVRWHESQLEFGDTPEGFQTAVQNSIDELGTGELDNPNFQSFQDVYDEILSWIPSDVQANRNVTFDSVSGEIIENGNPGETATEDFITEGFEVDLTANITDNWRVFFNIGQQESMVSNIALDVRDVAKRFEDNIAGSPIASWADTPTRTEGQSFISRYRALILGPLGAVAARDGQLARELREWRWNLVTSYSFTEGILDGFTVGGGVRWQDDNAIGYPNILQDGEIVPDLARPFLGPDQLNGDVFASYQRPIWDDKINWKIQLNVRNAFGDDDPIPVVINPDGRVAVTRNSQPREVFVTNTFSF